MKDNTKSRIIEKSIELFNENGYENVSMRNIADSLHMSPGNLTYHFNKKTDILTAIITSMIKEHKEKQYKSKITLSEFHNILSTVTKYQRKYAFYYRNYVELRKKYSMIAKMQADFKAEFLLLIYEALRYFESNGWIKEEGQEDMYENLSMAILATTTFWTQFHMEKDMTDVVWSILLPNLTEEGIKEYKKIVAKI